MSPGSAPISSFPGRILGLAPLWPGPTGPISGPGEESPREHGSSPCSLEGGGKGKSPERLLLVEMLGPDQVLEESATPYPLSVGS